MMAAKKKERTKYARSSRRDVESEMRRYKKGTAKSGRRRQGRQGEEPQASHRHWSFKSPQRGQARSEE
jgi:Family of unknown function (DUF6496)